jgi:hypothetical protein
MPNDEFIDLGITDKPHECTGMSISSGSDKPRYPCLYITSEEELDLGDAGVAEIKYKRTEKSEKTRDGKSTYCYELEIRGINPVSSEDVEEEEGDEPEAKVKVSKIVVRPLGEIIDKAKVKKSDY